MHNYKIAHILTLYVTLVDETCFVPSERVHNCGANLTEEECEANGCCYNISAAISCYYPSGTYLLYTDFWIQIENLYLGLHLYG